MERRQFLTLTAGITGAIALGQCSNAGNGPPSRSTLTSAGGQLRLDLVAAPHTVQIGGRSAQLLAYNGQVPGPTLEVQAGDAVHIRFTNGLDAPTNLHFHGLHIPPTGEADNPFRHVAPGETVDYRFTLPVDHPGGLFWYHPHHHGRVAAQVFGGLAGALIVRGAVDQLPEIQAAPETVLVLQDFDLDRRGQLRQPMPMFRRWGRQGNVVAVNGDALAALTVPANGLLRLRLLNASASRIYRLALDHPWHLIGLDGHPLPRPTPWGDCLLAPGERAAFLISGMETPSTYTLSSLPYDRGITAMMQGMQGSNGGRHGPGGGRHGPGGGRHGPGGGRHGGYHSRWDTETLPLAQLTYGPPGDTIALPTALPVPADLAGAIAQREFIFDHGIHQGQFFLINGQGFDPDRIDTTVTLGTVEDWRIVNKAGMDHPFHLHTNAFQVLRRNGEPEPFPLWKDTVNVPAYGSVDLRVAFRDFPGKTVYHCHILDHEDQGMMAILAIEPPA
jgi:FtsP/CotA-like multicopper oxidase with cupredoxin domain